MSKEQQKRQAAVTLSRDSLRKIIASKGKVLLTVLVPGVVASCMYVYNLRVSVCDTAYSTGAPPRRPADTGRQRVNETFCRT